MNNTELAEQIAATNGLTKADARKAVDGVFAAIADAAGKGDEVSLNGFGKFKVKNTPARGEAAAAMDRFSIPASAPSRPCCVQRADIGFFSMISERFELQPRYAVPNTKKIRIRRTLSARSR